MFKTLTLSVFSAGGWVFLFWAVRTRTLAIPCVRRLGVGKIPQAGLSINIKMLCEGWGHW